MENLETKIIEAFEGKVVRKDLAFEHLANDSIENIVSKTNQYTRNELERKRNKHYGLVSFLWRPFFRFSFGGGS